MLAEAEATNSNARGTDNASTFRDHIDIRVLLDLLVHAEGHCWSFPRPISASEVFNNGFQPSTKNDKTLHVNEFSHFLKRVLRSRILKAFRIVRAAMSPNYLFCLCYLCVRGDDEHFS